MQIESMCVVCHGPVSLSPSSSTGRTSTTCGVNCRSRLRDVRKGCRLSEKFTFIRWHHEQRRDLMRLHEQLERMARRDEQAPQQNSQKFLPGRPSGRVGDGSNSRRSRPNQVQVHTTTGRKDQPVGRPAKEQPDGQQYGRLTVLGVGIPDDRGLRWKCRCACGDVKHVRPADLRSGRVKSCGCWRREGRPKKTN